MYGPTYPLPKATLILKVKQALLPAFLTNEAHMAKYSLETQSSCDCQIGSHRFVYLVCVVARVELLMFLYSLDFLNTLENSKFVT